MKSNDGKLEFQIIDETTPLPEFIQNQGELPYVLIPKGTSALRTRNSNPFDVVVWCNAVGDWQTVSPVAHCTVPAGQTVDFSFVNLPLAMKGRFNVSGRSK